ncbi:amidase [Cryobacterium sp. TMT1-21]|uniref:Amidase n=1 Tax=Cryobacterium shii TaxID=1259235 RepID=A0AAQ2C4D9_9MICO|nr:MULTISPECIES: amidase [Cryobacterium]TFC42490.1 amidase [Cryobacterium shii]TFC80822.1 amidase [Cryobacterium sp. TmT2-59]TFD13250.1 amidase [Cryobacterium sp. TMT1-21]TFD18671.1 amidase [Cryobacterium sp. TMT4-10]TFD28473.1 amidase [Cryobacterium sp. TMT2-23]
MAAPHELTALEQWQALQRGELSPVELTDHYLGRIEDLDPCLGAFVTVTADAARERARFVQDHVPRTAPLWGLPFGDKDLQRRAGVPARFGSRLMRDFVPDESDGLVQALDMAGGVSLGKTNTPEFGLPSYTESLASPPARNPWDRSRGAGGSSGGAAVAVAARLLPFAPGSDGGGSVRIPAAACGLVGLKPSRGRVPTSSGIDALGGLSVAGPLARTVTDAALLLDAMVTPRGGHPKHQFALRPPGDDAPLLAAAVRGEGRFQLGVMTASAWDDAYPIEIAPEALAALATATDEFAALGHGLEDTALEPDDSYSPAFRTIWQAGAAGIPAETPAEESLLEPLTLWLMRRGRALSARDLAEALAALAAYERSFIRQLSRFDAVLTPALALTPRPLGSYDQADGERNFAQQVQYTPFTSMVNVTGLPAIVLPVAQTGEGLPMGVQLIGRPGGEATLLALGAQLERRLRWQHRTPPEPRRP